MTSPPDAGAKPGADEPVKVRWLRPNVVDGTIRWPECEEREEEGKECLLAAKVDYRGVMLCRRHASSRALKELASEPF